MAFEKVIGQRRTKAFFETAFVSKRIAHAYLFTGEKGVGKEAMALEVAKALICARALSCQSDVCPDCSRIAKTSHPDLKVIFPSPAKLKEAEALRVLNSLSENPYNRLDLWANPSISIERIRELRRLSSFKSYEGKGRVVLIFEVDRMTPEASNALLKILEEPPEKMHLILTSSRPTLILPTISSRCQIVKFDPLPTPDIEAALVQREQVDEDSARVVAKLADGSFRRALELRDDGLSELQKTALDFFRKSVQSQSSQINYVDDLLFTFQRDLKRTKELLKLVAYWLRDAMIYRETDGEGRTVIVNEDQQEVIRKFTVSFPNADLYSAVMEIERSLELMNRNVQINLILVVLLNKLRSYLKRT